MAQSAAATTIPYNAEFAGLPAVIDTFCDNLRAFYTSPLTRDVRQDRWHIVELCTYKKERNSQHEFLVAKAEGPVNPNEQDESEGKNTSNVFLRIERMSSAQNLLQILVNDALDRVKMTHVPTTKSTDYLVDTLRFSKGSFPTLPQLVVFVRTVSEAHPRYNLVSWNCYWFADTVGEVLRQRYLPTAQANSSTTSCVPVEEQKEAAGPRKGYWKGVPVVKHDKELVTEILHAFEKRWEEFNEQVDVAARNIQG
ncbi:hypothetical protein AMATHDRAFT_5909 [Amanita thiersii Skay4041]|uniref:Uncharacterized protein n=1 Tax=Amanita thiersii Skay4041 TaxID=703135 RepID=A0A2A9NE47_9AGAR|nr:hypothetical protein AMATHDRAFT_5909 [Amanita thiersii Skay4041]